MMRVLANPCLGDLLHRLAGGEELFRRFVETQSGNVLHKAYADLLRNSRTARLRRQIPRRRHRAAKAAADSWRRSAPPPGNAAAPLLRSALCPGDDGPGKRVASSRAISLSQRLASAVAGLVIHQFNDQQLAHQMAQVIIGIAGAS
jgi:anti-sigma factor RsiW